MIRCQKRDEPDYFEENVRKKGRQWLRDTPDAVERDRPKNCWRSCLSDLRNAFDGRCAYAAMKVEAKGTVDHFKSWAKTKKTRPNLAYEWSNYRFCSAAINSIKNRFDNDVLDPFEVRKGWFVVTLPDMQLLTTSRIPKSLRKLAERTIVRLELRDGEDLVQYRRSWYDEYKNSSPGGRVDILRIIEDHAPLVADAIRKWESTGQPLP